MWIGQNDNEDNQANNKAKNCANNTPHQADGAPGGGHASFLRLIARDNTKDNTANTNTQEVEDTANYTHRFAWVSVLWVNTWLWRTIWLWHWCNWLLVGLLILVCLLRLRLWLGHRLWLHGWLWLWCWLRCGRLLGRWLVVHRLLVLGYYRSVHLPYAYVICGRIIAEEGYCVNLLMIYIPHRGILHPTNFLAEGVDLLVELGEIVAVGDEVVGNGDGAALLDIFNF